MRLAALLPSRVQSGHGVLLGCVLFCLASAPAGAWGFESIRIETGPGGNAAELGSRTLVAGDTLRVYAAGYDSTGAYFGGVVADWSAAPARATLTPAQGTTTLVRAVQAGSFELHATAGAVSDTSGTLVIVPGDPVALSVFTTPPGFSPPLDSLLVSADTLLVLYAGGFDTESNLVGYMEVDWSIDAPIATLVPDDASLTVLSATRTGTGHLRLETAGLPIHEVPIQVVPGRLAELVLTIPPDSLTALGDTTLAVADLLPLRVTGFDSDGNRTSGTPVVDWRIAGTGGTLSVLSGTQTTFEALEPGSARIIASKNDVETSSGIVRVDPGPLARLRLSLVPDQLQPVGALQRSSDDRLLLWALGEDASGFTLGPVPANWTTTNPAVATTSTSRASGIEIDPRQVGTARIVIQEANAVPDTSGILSVVAGVTSLLRIETHPDGTGTEIASPALSADSSLALYAVGRDADANFTGLRNASWMLTEPIGELSSASGTTTILDATRPGTAKITASSGGDFDETGTLSVTPGAPHHLRVEDTNGSFLSARLLRPDESLDVFASLRDADDNSIVRIPVSWSWMGDTLATATPDSTSLFSWTAERTGRGRLRITTENALPDTSGWITVTSGALSRLEIRDAYDAGGSIIGQRTLSPDSALTLFAAAYDGGENYLGEVQAQWTVESLGGTARVEPSVGSSTILQPENAGPLLLHAQHSSGLLASTDTLTVLAGRLIRIVVEAVTDSGKTKTMPPTLASGDMLVLQAVGLDQWDNATGPEVVDWVVQGEIGDVEPVSGNATTFVAGLVGQGFVEGRHSNAQSGVTDEMTIQAGQAVALFIESTSGDPFDPIQPQALSTDDSLQAFAVLRDAAGNWAGDVNATWSIVESPQMGALSTSGPSTRTWFLPRQPSSGRLRATWSTFEDTTATLQVVPGTATGWIAVTAQPENLRADDRSSVGLLAGPLRDRFGNLVADGTRVDFSVDSGRFVPAEDLDGATPGLQRATFNGQAPATLVASESPGSAQVDVSSGTAQGSLSIPVLPRAELAYGPNSLVPSDVQRGDAITVRLRLSHSENINLHVQTATLRFDDGNDGAFTTTLPSPVAIPPGSGTELGFATRVVPELLNLGNYAPIVEIGGTDDFGHAFDQTLVLPPSSLQVTSLRLLAVRPVQTQVTRGDTLFVDVDCEVAAGTLDLDAAGTNLLFDRPSEWTSWLVGPPDGTALSAGTTHVLRFQAVADADATIGPAQIDARARATGRTSAVVARSAASTAVVHVVLGARGTFVSRAPGSLARGQAVQFEIEIRNDGDGDAILNPSTTILSDATGDFIARLNPWGDTVLEGAGATSRLLFEEAVWPAGSSLGDVPLVLELRGSQDTGTYSETFDVPAVHIRTPAFLAYESGSLEPLRTGAGSRPAVRLGARNTGGTVLQLGTSSRLRIAGREATLAFPDSIPPQAVRELVFSPIDLAGVALGRHGLELWARGTAEEAVFAQDLVLSDSLEIVPPAALALVDLATSQTRLTAGQARPWSLDCAVANQGGISARLDSLRLRFWRAEVDVTSEYTFDLPVAFTDGTQVVAAGTNGGLQIDIEQTGSTLGQIRIDVFAKLSEAANGNDLGWISTEEGGAATVQIESPPALDLLALVPSQSEIVVGQSVPWSADLVVENTGSADLELVGTSWTADVDGSDRTLEFGFESPEVFLSTGTRILAGHTQDTLRVRVPQTGTTPGALVLRARLVAQDALGGELLDERALDSEPWSLVGPAALVSGALLPSTPRVLAGGDRPWSIEIEIENSGEAALRLVDAETALLLRVDGVDRTADFAPQLASVPGPLEAAGRIQLRYEIASTPDLPGQTTAELALQAREMATGRSLELEVSGAGPRLERPAVLQVLRIEPQRASRGAPVRFLVDLVNTGEATAEIDTSTTLALGNLSVPLEIPITLAAAETLQARLQQIVVPHDQPLGATSTTLHVRGTQAGDVLAQDPPGGSVAIEAPAALTILGLEPSQPSVTRGQNRTWSVKMVVRNSGQAEYRVDSADLRIFLNGLDRTGTYTLAMQKASGGSLKPAENDTLRFVVTHTGDETGIATLEGSLRATDLNSGESLEANTFWGGKGTLRVQEPALPVADPLQLAQTTMTSGQTRLVEILLPFRNTGEAELVLDTSDLASTLESIPAVSVQAELASGDPVLQKGEGAMLRYTLGPWNVPEGSLVLHATPRFVETNRALDMTITSSDSVLVQSPADVQVTQVDGPPRVTGNQTRPWDVRFTLVNRGASAAALQNPALVLERGGVDVTDLFTVQVPSHFDGEIGTTGFDLPGGIEKDLTCTVLSTDETPGDLEATIRATSLEQNSGRSSDLVNPHVLVVRVERAPEVTFVDSTLTPRTANHGQRLELRIRARNGGEATVAIDHERTTVRLEGTSYVSNLKTTQTIPGGSDVELQFAPVSLPPDVGLGPHNVLLHLDGVENDNAWVSDQVAPEPIHIDAASSLEVLSVRASETLVTAAQERSWFVRVAVRNQGGAARFESSSLSFSLGASDVTSGFVVQAPTQFESGRDVLAAGVPDTLGFEITSTGDVEGLVLLDALVQARDLNSNEELEGRSFGQARGSVQVARPAQPVLVALGPSQETVSSGQNGDWHVLLHVRNEGGSPWRPDWSSAHLRIGAIEDDSLVVPVAFDSVPGVLRAGEEGHATFRVTRTGDERGSLDLVATLSGIQETDDASISARPHPPTSVRSESPPEARLDSLVAVLPRSPRANTGQDVTIAAHLSNTGEASIVRLELVLRAEGSSPADTVLVSSLAGASQKVFETRVHLRETVGPVSFELEGLRAIDANDATRTDAWAEPLWGTLALATETPGQLGLEVEPSQSSVSAGQTTPWWVTVLASNTGEEPLSVRTPRSTDLEFRRGGTLQADYRVEPPEEFEEGGLVIAGGDRGTLRYRIVTTGGEGGSVEIRARLAGAHANDPDHAPEIEEGTAAIQVDELPGLRILSTESITWRRQRGYDDFRVNTGQEFSVRVVVENTGGTPLDSIVVDLESERGNSLIEGPAFLEALDPGARGTLDVGVVAGTLRSKPGLPESFTAHVRSARDPNSGVSVLSGAAIDNTSFAYVETGAVLAPSAWIESPEGAQDGVLSAGQRFVVATRVENRGQAAISESGRVGLAVPTSFVLEEEESERFFAAGEVLRWTIRAPQHGLAAPETLHVSLPILPHDQNNGEEPLLETQDTTLTLQVQDTGTLEVDLEIASPAGAQDGTVSSGQEIVVFLDVRGHADLVDRRAELALPDGWSMRAGVPEDGSLPEEAQSRSLFTLIAGPATQNARIVAQAQAVDRNDGTPRQVFDTLEVEVQDAALLAVSTEIVEPEEARIGRVLPSQSFTLRARVRNHGVARVAAHAGGDPSETPHGLLRLASIPSGYQVARESVPFTLGPDGVGTADWQLVAPVAYRPEPERLRVVFEGLPVDENSGASVALHPDSSQAFSFVAIVDEGVLLEATPRAHGPAVAGECGVPFLDLRIVNHTENAVSLDSLGVLVLERGVPVGDPSKHLARLQLVREDHRPDTLHVALGRENPVWTEFVSEGPDKARGLIAPGETATFVLVGDLASGRRPGDLSLALRPAPDRPPLMRAVQATSRTPLAVRTQPGAALASEDLLVLPGTLHSYNAPNPFRIGREKTVIHYRLDRSALVRVRIHTLQGELVWEGIRNETTSGPSLGRMTWDGRNGSGIPVRNGVYVCRVQVGSRTTSFKIAVAR